MRRHVGIIGVRWSCCCLPVHFPLFFSDTTADPPPHQQAYCIYRRTHSEFKELAVRPVDSRHDSNLKEDRGTECLQSTASDLAVSMARMLVSLVQQGQLTSLHLGYKRLTYFI